MGSLALIMGKIRRANIAMIDFRLVEEPSGELVNLHPKDFSSDLAFKIRELKDGDEVVVAGRWIAAPEIVGGDGTRVPHWLWFQPIDLDTRGCGLVFDPDDKTYYGSPGIPMIPRVIPSTEVFDEEGRPLLFFPDIG